MRHVVNQFIIKYLLLNFLLALHHSHDMSNFINNCLARGFEIEFVKVYFGRIPPLYLLKISQTSIDLQIGRIKGIPYLIGKRVTVSDADRQPEYAELQISHIDAKAVNIGGKNCQFSAKIGHTLLLQMTNQTDDHCPPNRKPVRQQLHKAFLAASHHQKPRQP